MNQKYQEKSLNKATIEDIISCIKSFKETNYQQKNNSLDLTGLESLLNIKKKFTVSEIINDYKESMPLGYARNNRINKINKHTLISNQGYSIKNIHSGEYLYVSSNIKGGD